MDATAIARVCHEANRALQIEQADPAVPVARAWDEIADEMRVSVVSGVLGILGGNTPEQSHAGWIAFKEARGWVFGPVKDEAAKTHPCLVPYDLLPAGQQIKDHLFSAIVKSLA